MKACLDLAVVAAARQPLCIFQAISGGYPRVTRGRQGTTLRQADDEHILYSIDYIYD